MNPEMVILMELNIEHVSDHLDLDGEYVIITYEDGSQWIEECGTIEEIEEGNLTKIKIRDSQEPQYSKEFREAIYETVRSKYTMKKKGKTRPQPGIVMEYDLIKNYPAQDIRREIIEGRFKISHIEITLDNAPLKFVNMRMNYPHGREK